MRTYIPKPTTGILAGLMTTAPFMALLYLAEQVAGLPFVPFDLFDWIARTLPGDVITKSIDTIVELIDRFNLGETSSTAKSIETLSALALFLGMGTFAGIIAVYILDRFSNDRWTQIGGVIGLVLGLPIILISRDVNVLADASPTAQVIWLVVAFAAWGAAMAWIYRSMPEPSAAAEPGDVAASGETLGFAAEKLNRRQFLIRVGGATATITVAGTGLARYLEYRDEQDYKKLVAQRRARAAEIADILPNADDPVMPAPGTRPELTPLDDHYRIDISVRPPELDAEEWRLRITGLVDNPLELSIDDLRDDYDPHHQYVTLACISNPVGGDLTSTILWTGARLKEVLDDAGVQADGRFLKISSADGFYEIMDLALLDEDERIMLCYNWENIPLLHKHGFPLRIYIPDRYGMKQPKWITDMEVIAEYEEGYWVTRGWDEVARMRATSVVDVAASDRIVERDGQTLVPVGGIAHAGKRGISKVEVQVDDGDWMEAELREPLSETTWVIWRYDWLFEEGRHTFKVRCYESDGTMQITERNSARPSGATGIHDLSRSL